MPKRKATRQCAAVPKEDLTLSRDDSNVKLKGSKEDRKTAIEMFSSDFAIQSSSLRKQTLKQFVRDFNSKTVHEFDAIVKKFSKEVLQMPYEDYLRQIREEQSEMDVAKEDVEDMEDSVQRPEAKQDITTVSRERKRAMLRAQMDSEFDGKLQKMEPPPPPPPPMVTPANPPQASARHNQLSMSTKGRKCKQGEQLILTVTSQKGSPVSLDARAFQEAMSLRNMLTPFITGSRALPHM